MKTNTLMVLLVFLASTVCYAAGKPRNTDTASISNVLILSMKCTHDHSSRIEFISQGQRTYLPIRDRFCTRFKLQYSEHEPCSLRHADLILFYDKNPQPVELGPIRVIGIFNKRDVTACDQPEKFYRSTPIEL